MTSPVSITLVISDSRARREAMVYGLAATQKREMVNPALKISTLQHSGLRKKLKSTSLTSL